MSLKVAKIVTVEDVEVAVVDEAVIVDTIVVGIEADMTMIEATEEVMMTAEEEAMTMGVTEDKIIIIMVVEEEDDMMIAEETIQAATLILVDAIDEIQTGDLPQKMISERLQQKRPRLDPGLNCNHER